MSTTLLPDLILDSRGVRSGIGVSFEGGIITRLGPSGEGERLPGRALAPGFVNDHSHAFQRALRGRSERTGDFWSWRETMYGLAQDLTLQELKGISLACYREMLRAGYTSVSEFHYLHHRPDGTLYEDPKASAEVVAEAAGEAGIRLLLLPAAYARGGIPRFRDPKPEVFLKRVEELSIWASQRPLLEVGIAAHSVRAVPREWLEDLAAYAKEHGLPLHIHACEQVREVEECKTEHGLTPIELLVKTGSLGPRTTVIHATHASERELDLLSEYDSRVCACPTTEGNLGDGFLPARQIFERGIDLSIGSDSQVRIAPFEELRELETNARRISQRRGVLVREDDPSTAAWLLQVGWQKEALEPGSPADFIEIDLDHPALAYIEPEDLTSALVFGADASVVSATWVAGKQVYRREER
ncbi:formimidoylglutamate deiminase [Rubrobacter naiadicus]|uniref:formimidoylglutamate deiminase n=1 Tax=Rubrobacter naiadicus TaxID=1392641 RepID=UPI00235F0767|nr:formimidoylglutamate deiminase [Rubrobacter naiadicus]